MPAPGTVQINRLSLPEDGAYVDLTAGTPKVLDD